MKRIFVISLLFLMTLTIESCFLLPHQEYQISYHLEEGEVNDPGNTSYYYSDTEFMELKPATRAGWDFLGWFDSSDGGVQLRYISGEMGMDLDLYARWRMPGLTVDDGFMRYLVNDDTCPEEIIFPESHLGERITGITSIRGLHLKKVTIPDSVVSVGDESFTNNTALTEVVFEGTITQLGIYVFDGCSSLEKLTTDQVFNAIPAGLFKDCAALSEWTLGPAVTEIGAEAFRGTSLVSLTIPETVGTIGEAAFRDCDSLSSISLPARQISSLESRIFQDCDALETVVIPSGMTAIPDDMFRDSDGLKEVRLPETLVMIGDNAFSACSSLDTVILPSALEQIGSNAFNSCALTEILIPSSVETMGFQVFGTYLSEDPLQRVLIEAAAKPSGWQDDWDMHIDGSAFVVYGYTE